MRGSVSSSATQYLLASCRPRCLVAILARWAKAKKKAR